MKKEWFEPGPDGKSRFTKLYRKSMDGGLLVSESISAAFRALLAEEEQVEPKDAEIARLTAERNEAVEARSNAMAQYDQTKSDFENSGYEIARLRAELHARNDEIVGLRAEVALVKEERDNLYGVAERWRLLSDAHEQGYTNILTREREVAAERDAAREALATMTKTRAYYENLYNESQAELGKARPNVGFLQGQVESVEARNAELRAEVERLEEAHAFQMKLAQEYFEKADALQARIEAGVPVYSATGDLWSKNKKWSLFTKLLIDACHIDQADHIADADKMMDERKGKADRREKNLFGVHGRPGKCDRRRVAGTRTGRGKK